MRLAELATLIRSKNAGPFMLTFDIMFQSESDYLRVKRSGALRPELISQIYGTSLGTVKFFECDNAYAFKFSIPRPLIQGSFGDADLHGGQQYAPLMEIGIGD